MTLLLAQSETDALGEELRDALNDGPTSPAEAVDVVGDKLGDLWTSILQGLPVIALGLVVFVVVVVVALFVARTFSRGVDRSGMDRSVAGLLTRLVRLSLLIVAVLFALSVMGVPVASVLGLLAVAGIAVGLAVQGILENFIAGIILLIRKPIRTGDQVITGEFEGTVEDIDFRVTRLLTYDGTVVLIPNGEVYANALTNLTTRGTRRSRLTVGVDYRDDHDRARAVIEEAMAAVEGVLADPPSEALLTELADSSVNFELRYWTAADVRSVRHAQDKVLSAVKRAIEDAGMTIPWPIRTLVLDGDSDIRVSDRRP